MDHLPNKWPCRMICGIEEAVFFNPLLGFPAANTAAGVNHSGGFLFGNSRFETPSPPRAQGGACVGFPIRRRAVWPPIRVRLYRGAGLDRTICMAGAALRRHESRD